MFFIRPPPSGDSSFYIGTCPGLKERPPGERPPPTAVKTCSSPEFAYKSKIFSSRQPPPPANDNWRTAAPFSGNNGTFVAGKRHLADGVRVFSPPHWILVRRRLVG